MRIFGLNRRIIRVLLGSQYAHMLEYRAEIALWALSGVLPFIMLSVWSGSDARSGLGRLEQLEGCDVRLLVPRDQLTAVVAQLLDRFPVRDLDVTDPPIEELIGGLFRQGRV